MHGATPLLMLLGHVQPRYMLLGYVQPYARPELYARLESATPELTPGQHQPSVSRRCCARYTVRLLLSLDFLPHGTAKPGDLSLMMHEIVNHTQVIGVCQLETDRSTETSDGPVDHNKYDSQFPTTCRGCTVFVLCRLVP